MDDRYCKKCILKKNHPGVAFDRNGFCLFCSPESSNYAETYRSSSMEMACESMEAAREFENANTSSTGMYDCIVMLSGGKDSIYILDRIVNRLNKKVLAYTFTGPYEAEAGLKNIELCKEKIQCDYISFSCTERYRRVMQAAFEKDVSGIGAERTPCTFCSSLMFVHVLSLARAYDIPYICRGAHGVQLFTYPSSTRKWLHMASDFLGEPLLRDILGNDLNALMNGDENELPKYVFPLASPSVGDYDEGRVLEEMKGKGVYRGVPIDTHCLLFPLLNYYSYRRFDCFFYATTFAHLVRTGAIPRRHAIEMDRAARNIFLHLLPGGRSDGTVKREIHDLLSEVYPGISGETIDNLFQLPRMIRELDVEI